MDWIDKPIQTLTDPDRDKLAFSHVASAKKTPILVLDSDVRHLIEAGADAQDLAVSIADAEGRLHDGLAIFEQIRALEPLSERPRYARLRLDPRGIAAPTTCWLARTVREDGSSVVVVGLPDPASKRRRPIATPSQEVSREVEESAAVPFAEPSETDRGQSERIVWRSDAQGRLNAIKGGSPGLVATLRGRLWSSFPDGGVPILAALRERRTFRGLTVIVRDDESGVPCELSVSGSPLARDLRAESAWAGFAHVRIPTDATAESDSGSEGDADLTAGRTPDDEPMRLPGDRVGQEHAATPPLGEVAAKRSEGAALTSEGRASPFHHAEAWSPSPNGRGEAQAGDAVLAAAGDASAQDLLSHEREAFREIARTLGALLHDAEPAAIELGARAALDERVSAGATIAAVLESLPAGVLVFRDREILFVNRRLSDLLGLDERNSTEGDDPLPSLLAQQDGERLVALPGVATRLLVERSAIDWDGGPASLVLARAAPAIFRWIEPTTTEGGGAFAAIARAPAMLRSLGESRGAIDPRGRVLVIKQALAQAAYRAPETSYGSAAGQRTISAPASARRAADIAANRAGRTRGAVVALRQRVEQLLAPDEIAASAAADESPPANVAVVERQQASDDTARRRFALFAKIGRAVRASLVAVRDAADDLLAETQQSRTPPDRDRIGAMRAANSEALSLLDGLLAWTLVASGRADQDRRSARLNVIVSDAIADLQAQAAKRRVLLRMSLSADVTSLDIDEPSLRRAVHNAVTHAVEQSPTGGQVIVSTQATERGEAVLRVRSTGFTMSAETIAEALDPLGGTDATAADSQRGLLGLTLAKALAEVNDGRLSISSRAGEGTLVELAFWAGEPKDT